MRSLRSLIVLIGLAALMATGVSAPANAASGKSYADLQSIKVKNTKKTLVLTYVLKHPSRAYVFDSWCARVELDTAKKKGAEWTSTANFCGKKRVEFFRPKKGKAASWAPGKKCAKTVSQSYKLLSGDRFSTTVTVKKKKGCFNAKTVRARWSAKTYRNGGKRWTADFLPNKPNAWTKKVKVGKTKTFKDAKKDKLKRT